MSKSHYSINYWEVQGRLTKDPLLQHTHPKKAAFVRTTVAINFIRKDGKADFVHVIAWEELAHELMSYRKGDEIRLSGHFRTRHGAGGFYWPDCVVDKVLPLTDKPRGAK